ncbi:MAG: ClcB-like voltage-gated chloride channel protein [Verrucomicrobia bacterium]|nr:ClcB-like voltage-gated chloride channel protein [Verrucomicrobiota bacterium]
MWARGTGAALEWGRRHWLTALTLRDRVRFSEEAFHLVIAGAVGLIAGVIYELFHGLNALLQWAAWGQSGEFLKITASQPVWRVAVVPALGGLFAGLVLWFGLRLLGNPGLTNLLEVVVAGDGRLPLRVGLINALSSIFSIATGATIGREGLTVQLSATVSSRLGQWAKWPPYRLRMLVACGAAAGLSCALNAPIAGAVFAAQIVLGNFSMSLFAPALVASVVAALVSRTLFGSGHWYEVPAFDFTKLSQLPWFLVLGILSGMLGALFQKMLRWSDQFCSQFTVPLFVRLAVAGLAVGCLAVRFPEVLGNGYDGTNEILRQPLPLLALIEILLARLLATVFTVGAGAVGGVFTPTLFLGAALGSVLGSGLHELGLASTLPVGAFALVGMGSMLAATTHSPLLAIIVIFELSMNYSVMPPLMLACAVSTLVARGLHKDSVYTEPLRRKGLTLARETSRAGAATQRTVGDVMRAPVPPVREAAPFRELADRFLTSSNNFLPVVDGEKRLVGLVALHDLKQHLNAGQELNSVIAYDLMRPVPASLTPDQKLVDVLAVLVAAEMRNVPVVNNRHEQRLIGAVVRADALGLVSEAIAAKTSLMD